MHTRIHRFAHACAPYLHGSTERIAHSVDIEKLINSTSEIAENLDSIQTKAQEAKVQQELDSKFVVENLTRLVHSINAVEASSQEFSRNSAVLSQNIAEVNQYLS